MRVVVIDDHPVIRKMVCNLLRSEESIEVVGQAASAQEALETIRSVRPDVALLDLSILRDFGMLEFVGEIKRLAPSMQVILLSEHTADSIVQSGIAAGAAGYVVKSHAVSELIMALRAASRGDRFISPRVTKAANNSL